jgi:hypothetical protein
MSGVHTGRTLWLALVLGGGALTACGQRETGAAVVPGAAAGTVVQASGSVTATRAGASRALAVGDTVSADDVVTTGADGRVAIELLHNHVRWSLGPGREKQVSASAAWTAAQGSTEIAVTDERSGAAGRHAEREAADTAASAAPSPSPSPSPSPPPPPAAAKASRRAAAPEPPPQMLSSDVSRGDAAELRAAPPELTDAQIDRAVKPRLAALRACHRGSEPVTVDLVFAIDDSGAVTAVTFDGTPQQEPLHGCLTAAARAARFPAGGDGRVARYRLVLR